MAILNFLAMLLNPLKKYRIFVDKVLLVGWGEDLMRDREQDGFSLITCGNDGKRWKAV
jgi:hypothetical protein